VRLPTARALAGGGKELPLPDVRLLQGMSVVLQVIAVAIGSRKPYNWVRDSPIVPTMSAWSRVEERVAHVHHTLGRESRPLLPCSQSSVGIILACDAGSTEV
jgi:hypothetical protein